VQIQKDIEFTNKINELTKSHQLEPIKHIIFTEIAKHKSPELHIDESFFMIEQSEMDPLESGQPGWYKRFSEEELEQEAFKVYKMYKEIEQHFSSKLENRF
jgi:hypothetical protein